MRASTWEIPCLLSSMHSSGWYFTFCKKERVCRGNSNVWHLKCPAVPLGNPFTCYSSNSHLIFEALLGEPPSPPGRTSMSSVLTPLPASPGPPLPAHQYGSRWPHVATEHVKVASPHRDVLPVQSLMGFQRLSTKKVKYLINNFFIDYIVK